MQCQICEGCFTRNIAPIVPKIAFPMMSLVNLQRLLDGCKWVKQCMNVLTKIFGGFVHASVLITVSTKSCSRLQETHFDYNVVKSFGIVYENDIFLDDR